MVIWRTLVLSMERGRQSFSFSSRMSGFRALTAGADAGMEAATGREAGAACWQRQRGVEGPGLAGVVAQEAVTRQSSRPGIRG